jgi:cytochrome c biogenesis protein CcmG/thiol:disulfide interchange protein DsbE
MPLDVQFFRRAGTLVTAVALALFLTACDTATQSADPAEMKPVSFQQWEEQLESYRPSVVVVDLWAMWCTSCIKRFPKMVDMHDKYSQEGVQIVALNLDNRQDQAAVQQAQEFLREINATFDNYHMDENLIDAFERFKLVGIPAVIIYDGQGRERFRLTGDNPNDQFTDEDIENAINELLAEQQTASL